MRTGELAEIIYTGARPRINRGLVYNGSPHRARKNIIEGNVLCRRPNDRGQQRIAVINGVVNAAITRARIFFAARFRRGRDRNSGGWVRGGGGKRHPPNVFRRS